MRTFLIILVLAVLVGLGYAAWPFYGLYALGNAVHTADAGDAMKRIDLPAVRRSILHQVLDEGTKGTELEERLGSVGRQFAASAAAAALDERAAEVFTPEILRDLIASGRLPEALQAEGGQLPETGAAQGGLSGAGAGLPQNPLRFLQGFSYRSPVKFKVVVGEEDAPENWTGLEMRLSGTLWRLTGIELPQSVMSQIVPVVREKIERAS